MAFGFNACKGTEHDYYDSVAFLDERGKKRVPAIICRKCGTIKPRIVVPIKKQVESHSYKWGGIAKD